MSDPNKGDLATRTRRNTANLGLWTGAWLIALGVALVAGLAYSTADVIDLIAFDAEISRLVFLIGVTCLLGVLLGRGRYR